MKTSTLTGIITAVAIGAVGVAAITPAFAYGGKDGARGQGPRFDFEMLDANSDGKVTQEEMTEHRAAEFDARDTDSDGFLSKEELIQAALERAKQGMEQRVERMLENRDADKDGKVSLAELTDETRGAKMFERLDKDGDGAISAEEMETMKKRFGRGHGKEGHGKRWQQQEQSE